MEEDINKIWSVILAELEKQIPASSFTPWVLPLVPHSYDNSSFSVLCGQMLAVQVLQKNFSSQIHKVLEQILKKEVEFKIIYDENLAKQLKKKGAKAQKEEAIEIQAPSKYENLKQMQSSPNLNLKYKFENFVVGENNKFAYGAALCVAQSPGKKYNPLFIYGGAGLGKTHLMQSIGHHILLKHPKLKVKFVKLEEFVNDLINSIFKGADKGNTSTKMDNFRQKYRQVDVLLIDDIQFIEGKERTVTEIFNTFECLHSAGKQIVITSDRPPSAISALPDRLRSRFEMGLMVDVQPPDIETRIAILQNLALESDTKINTDVINFLATVYKNNVRELEGAYNRVSAYSTIHQTDLNVEIVKKIINYSEKTKNITIPAIIDHVGQYFNVSTDDLKSLNRMAKIARARQVAIYLSRELTQESYPYIAEIFEKKHTTILYSYEKIKEELKTDKELSSRVLELIDIIKK